MSVRAASLALAALVLLVATERRAGATDDKDKEVCIRAVEHAQVARLDGKLLEARAGFVTCARAVCPDAIRQDCTRWVTDVDASLPSVVFEAVWADGRDATGTRVLIDGKPLADHEPGRAVILDPGEHTFHFEVTGATPVETRNVIREGEKNRIIRATFTPSAPAPAPASATTQPPDTSASSVPASAGTAAPANLWQPVPPPEQPAHRPIPIAAYVLGGVALASFGAFAYLGLDGTSRLDAMRSGANPCAPWCKADSVSSARNEVLAGDILGFAGLAAAGVATWLALARP